MAVRVKLDSLNEQQKKIIRECLYLQPKNTNFAAGKQRFYQNEKEPILFYWIDKPKGEIVLPYTFANTLLGQHINSQLKFPPGRFIFMGQLRENQIDPVNKAWEQLDTLGTTTLSLPTGYGKSICSAYLSAKCLEKSGGLVMVITPRDTIQQGWYETFTKETTAAVWIVENTLRIPELCNVILCMNTRFDKLPREITSMVSTLVLDEAHLLCVPSNVSMLLGTCPKYVIACTATLERTDDLHKMIQTVAGTHKVEVKNEKFFTVYKLNTGIQSVLTKNKQGTTDFANLTKTLSMDPVRNAIIVDLVEKNPNKKVMILSWNKQHVKVLHDVFKNRGQSVDFLAGTKSSYEDSRILLGTISKVGTGFDAKNVAINWDGLHIDTLILAGSTKSLTLHTQTIGRAFRSNNPTIIDLVDDNPIAKRHWLARKKNYDSLNCEIKEFFLNVNALTKNEMAEEEALQAGQLERVNKLREKMALKPL
jgi:superfamily II DNA or RNA helicase